MSEKASKTREDLERALQSLEADPTALEQLKHLLRELQRHLLELEARNGQLETDITELRQSQLRQSLNARLSAVTTIVAGIAHELNNPLAFLMNSLDIATQALHPDAPSGAQTTSTLLKALSNVQVGAERIQDIVRGLAAFSRPAMPRSSQADVQQVLELALKLAQGELHHRARIVRDYVKVPEVLTDAARLGQVFLNLLVSAAQSIPEGASDRNELRLRIHPQEQGVLVQIRDTGEGMSPQALARILAPSRTAKPEGQDAEHGLATSHRMILELGGTLTVDSHPGIGTTFSIRLPTPPAPEETSPPPATLGSGAALRRGRILVVDDEHRFGQTLQLLLGRYHEVSYTPSAREALGWLQEGKSYDAILCDLMMAEVTGKQFHEALSLHSEDLARRVIFMTGGAYTPSSMAFVKQMTNPLLTKPFRSEELEKLLIPLLPSV